MKTEIVHACKPKKGFNIDSVLLIDRNTFAIFTSKHKSDSFLEILKNGVVSQYLNLSTINTFDTRQEVIIKHIFYLVKK